MADDIITSIFLHVKSDAVAKFAEAGAAAKGSAAEMAGVGTASSGMGSLVLKATAGAVVGLAGMAAGAILVADKFDHMTTVIANNTGMSNKQLENMRQAVLKLGADSPAPLSEIAQGFEKAANAGIYGSTAFNLVKESMRAAVETGGNTATMVDNVTLALKNFKLPVSEAGHVLGILMSAAAQGDIRLPDLAQNFNKVSQIAGAMKQPLIDTAANYATITRYTHSASLSQTEYYGMLNKILAPTKAAQTAIEDLSKSSGIDLVGAFEKTRTGGETVNQLMGQTRDALGLSSAGMKDLSQRYLEGKISLDQFEHSGGAAIGTLFSLFGGIRGGNAALALMVQGWQDNKDILDKMRNSLGLVNDQWGRTTAEMGAKSGILRNHIEEIGIAFGNQLIPYVNKGIDSLNQFSGFVLAHMPQIQQSVSGAAKDIGSALDTLGSIFLGTQHHVSDAVTQLGLVSPAFDGIAKSVEPVNTQMVGTAGAFETATNKGKDLVNSSQDLVSGFSDLKHAGDNVGASIDMVTGKQGGNRLATEGATVAIKAALLPLELQAKGFQLGAVAIEFGTGKVKDFIPVAQNASHGIGDFAAQTARDLPQFANTVSSNMSTAGNSINTFAWTGLEHMGTWASGTIQHGATAATGFVGHVATMSTGALSDVGTMIGNMLGKLGTWVGDMIAKAVSAAKGFITGLHNIISGAVSVIGDMITAITGALSGLAKLLFDAGAAAGKALGDGLGSAIDYVKGKVGGLLSAIGGLTQHLSPPKDAKWFDMYTWGLRHGSAFGDGLGDSIPVSVASAGRLLDAVKAPLEFKSPNRFGDDPNAWGFNVGKGMGDGLLASVPFVAAAAATVLTSIKKQLANYDGSNAGAPTVPQLPQYIGPQSVSGGITDSGGYGLLGPAGNRIGIGSSGQQMMSGGGGSGGGGGGGFNQAMTSSGDSAAMSALTAAMGKLPPDFAAAGTQVVAKYQATADKNYKTEQDGLAKDNATYLSDKKKADDTYANKVSDLANTERQKEDQARAASNAQLNNFMQQHGITINAANKNLILAEQAHDATYLAQKSALETKLASDTSNKTAEADSKRLSALEASNSKYLSNQDAHHDIGTAKQQAMLNQWLSNHKGVLDTHIQNLQTALRNNDIKATEAWDKAMAAAQSKKDASDKKVTDAFGVASDKLKIALESATSATAQVAAIQKWTDDNLKSAASQITLDFLEVGHATQGSIDAYSKAATASAKWAFVQSEAADAELVIKAKAETAAGDFVAGLKDAETAAKNLASSAFAELQQKEFDLAHGITDTLPPLGDLVKNARDTATNVKAFSDAATAATLAMSTDFASLSAAAVKLAAEDLANLETKVYDLAHGINDNLGPLNDLKSKVIADNQAVSDHAGVVTAASALVHTDFASISAAATKLAGEDLANLQTKVYDMANGIQDSLGPIGDLESKVRADNLAVASHTKTVNDAALLVATTVSTFATTLSTAQTAATDAMSALETALYTGKGDVDSLASAAVLAAGKVAKLGEAARLAQQKIDLANGLYTSSMTRTADLAATLQNAHDKYLFDVMHGHLDALAGDTAAIFVAQTAVNDWAKTVTYVNSIGVPVAVAGAKASTANTGATNTNTTATTTNTGSYSLNTGAVNTNTGAQNNLGGASNTTSGQVGGLGTASNTSGGQVTQLGTAVQGTITPVTGLGTATGVSSTAFGLHTNAQGQNTGSVNLSTVGTTGHTGAVNTSTTAFGLHTNAQGQNTGAVNLSTIGTTAHTGVVKTSATGIGTHTTAVTTSTTKIGLLGNAIDTTGTNLKTTNPFLVDLGKTINNGTIPALTGLGNAIIGTGGESTNLTTNFSLLNTGLGILIPGIATTDGKLGDLANAFTAPITALGIFGTGLAKDTINVDGVGAASGSTSPRITALGGAADDTKTQMQGIPHHFKAVADSVDTIPPHVKNTTDSLDTVPPAFQGVVDGAGVTTTELNTLSDGSSTLTTTFTDLNGVVTTTVSTFTAAAANLANIGSGAGGGGSGGGANSGTPGSSIGLGGISGSIMTPGELAARNQGIGLGATLYAQQNYGQALISGDPAAIAYWKQQLVYAQWTLNANPGANAAGVATLSNPQSMQYINGSANLGNLVPGQTLNQIQFQMANYPMGTNIQNTNYATAGPGWNPPGIGTGTNNQRADNINSQMVNGVNVGSRNQYQAPIATNPSSASLTAIASSTAATATAAQQAAATAAAQLAAANAQLAASQAALAASQAALAALQWQNDLQRRLLNSVDSGVPQRNLTSIGAGQTALAGLV